MAHAEADRIRRLLHVGRELIAELDSEAVLQRILDAARGLTGAEFAALGVLDEDRNQLARFLTSGVAAETHAAIGELPRGRGVLGVLISDPRALRLEEVGNHPESYGFPPGHPRMHSFLGVPITIRNEAWGNLYLAEKTGGVQFDAGDEEAVGVLAEWAGVAIENARLYEQSEQRREQSERTARSLRAARDITDAIGGSEDLQQVLELIVKRGRALVEARSVLIMLRDGEDLVVSASAGHAPAAPGHRIPISGSTAGQVLLRRSSRRIDDAVAHLLISPADLGVPDAQTAMMVPMVHRGAGVGVLAAFDRGQSGGPFTSDDEQLLANFAQSAANAVAIRRSVEAERLRSAIAAADAERRRWARELHDQTLQALGGLRVLLASAARRADPAGSQAAIGQAVSDIELEIENLRGIISDLRPSLLDDIGLLPAVEALVERRRQHGLQIESHLELPDAEGGAPGLAGEVETTAYRLVQEALTNVVKHADAHRVHVTMCLEDDQLRVEIRDDGRGFDPQARTSGFGLAGMRERVYLTGGVLEVASGAGGTSVRARLPIDETSPASGSFLA
jgi:signal transduction histidine kinase